ncbi:MAG: hydrogenase expression/formation protein HypE, partial [Desulfatitalea sp.]|nr:hydrogenase expression/formation protein HypE [Desulfatitalea sp.]
MDVLRQVLASARAAMDRAGVQLITGDTKVVPRGAADKLFINTAGIGVVPPGVCIRGDGARPGDQILLSGRMADHGIAVLVQREHLQFETAVRSDTAPLDKMVGALLAAAPGVRVLRDPTRGGVGTALNEIAVQSRVGMVIEEARLPVDPAVAGICDLLGFDPLYIANEGKLLCCVPADQAAAALTAIRSSPYGQAAAIIGEVVADHPGRVVMTTRIGGQRIVDMLSGEQLPRIC